ncbi:MAG TPA: PD-(D/E)XK nuclease family protein [Candidatus Limiplasma stercoravium]|nr:PD-(D/E)XK nuclease family protein [Candidatus Limiplasma stercoravium]
MDVTIHTARAHRLFAPMAQRLGELNARCENVLVLVPEQFTLAAERALMDALKLEGMFYLQVLSPSRLAERVLDLAGRDDRQPLDDAGRRMALSQAAEMVGDSLTYYASIAQKRGFVERMSALITDMKRGGLEPEALLAHAQKQEGAAQEKLSDLACLYAAYRTVLGERFCDSEDQLDYVAARLERSGLLTERHLFVYGFDTLPQQLMRLLCAAAPLAHSLSIWLTCDGEEANDGELYLPIRQGVSRFCDMLRSRGMAVRVQALPRRPLRHAPAIDHLDAALFGRVAEPKEAAGVYLSSSLSPFEEATRMTRQVMALQKQGEALERIAVMYPESGGYAFAVAAALADSGLPYYTDEKLPATSHGLARFLLCALRAMAQGYSNRDVLPLLKSGYAPLSFEEACELEIYARSYGIDRARWLSPFTRGPQEECARMEPLRQRLIAPLETAHAALRAARTSRDSCAAVFSLLQAVGAYDALRREEETLLANGLQIRANQNCQIWQALLSLLDQLARLGGPSRIPLRHIANRLECGLSAISLASLPPGAGMLHAGALGHMLPDAADYVFLLGLNDGLLSDEGDSLLTAQEREEAQTDTGCFLGLTDHNRGLMKRLDLKRAATLPRKALYLSYAKTASDGTALRPLSLLADMQRRILPKLGPWPAGELPLSARQALAALGPRLRAQAEGATLPALWNERLQALLDAPQTAPDAMRLLSSLEGDAPAQPLDRDTARRLYGEEALSVSRLEQFAQCPFRHYVSYGLRPRILKEWKVDPIETGTFYHDSLNRFGRMAMKRPQYPTLSPEEVERMACAAMEPLEQEILQGPMGDGERGLARYRQARAAVCRAAQTVTRQLAAGRFALYKTEASFGYEGGLPPVVLSLSDGRAVALRGRIDRIDRYDAPDAVYLRVIDYKSSRQDLDATRTWWGLQLQLLVYLDACVAALPGSKPAGAFYFYVADPVVESESDAQAYVETRLCEALRLRGLALSDVSVVDAMDASAQGVSLPSLFTKAGDLRKTAKALDMAQFTALMAHARGLAASLAQRILDGETAIAPVRSGSTAACDYCDYAAICRFAVSDPDAPLRSVEPMDMEALRAALRETKN